MLSSFYTLTIPLAVPVASRVLVATRSPCVGDMPPVVPGDIVPFGIDFSSKLSAGDSIVAASAAVAVYMGSDSDPADLADVDAYVSGTQVNQILGSAWIEGVTYTWTVTADTALGAQFVNYAHISCFPIK